MCKINEYVSLYTNAAGVLRHQGLKPEIPGFEILKVAIVVFKNEEKDIINSIIELNKNV